MLTPWNYIKFYLNARTKYDIHSPFLFDLLDAMFDKDRIYNDMVQWNEEEAMQKLDTNWSRAQQKCNNFLRYLNIHLLLYGPEVSAKYKLPNQTERIPNDGLVKTAYMLMDADLDWFETQSQTIDEGILAAIVLQPQGTNSNNQQKWFRAFENTGFNFSISFSDRIFIGKQSDLAQAQHIHYIEYWKKPWRAGFFS